MPSRYRRPATPAERERRDQAHADKLAALHQQLTQQVAALTTGEDWRRWLQVAARLPTYSFNNTLLIAAQRPDATAVAGYRAWQTLGRQVTKGEQGLRILAPVLRRRTRDEPDPEAREGAGRARDEGGTAPSGADSTEEENGRADGGAREVAGFRVAYVWDVSQTTGEPLPEPPRPQLLAGQAPPGMWDSLTKLLADQGFTVQRRGCGEANGWTDYVSRNVRVRGDVDDAQAVRTLAHEAGHVLLHNPGDVGESTTAHCRGIREVEAESVVYLTAASHGMDTAGYTFPYLAGWAAGVDHAAPEQVVRDTGQRVMAAASTVLAATQPDTTPTADPALAARAQAGAERTAAARGHADTALAHTQAAEADPAAGEYLDTLARLHADAAAFYTAQLTAGTPAAAYLTGRAVPPAAASGFEIGYAPPGWTTLTDHLHALGYPDRQLLDAGLAMPTRRGGVVDRFRDRLMFPVRDPAGERVIAFLGRALATGDDTPKYLNSPQTPLYRKGEVLYGLGAHPTRQALAAGAHPVLVEGPLDAIAVTGAGGGRYAGVAPSGTALTAAQVANLDRHAGPLAERGVTVAFDGDRAGRQAALRAYGVLRTAGAWPTTTVLPDGQDPASLTQHHGPGALPDALEVAVPLADLVVDERLTRWSERLHWIEGRIGAARDAARLIATLPPEQVSRQALRVADLLQLEHSVLTAAIADAISPGDNNPKIARRDRREHLHYDRPVTPAATAAQLAANVYPAPLRELSRPPIPTAARSSPEPGPVNSAVTAASREVRLPQ